MEIQVAIDEALHERVLELERKLAESEAREAAYREHAVHHEVCGFRDGMPCDCWLADLGEGDDHALNNLLEQREVTVAQIERQGCLAAIRRQKAKWVSMDASEAQEAVLGVLGRLERYVYAGAE